jgi:outer membrane protein TolC
LEDVPTKWVLKGYTGSIRIFQDSLQQTLSWPRALKISSNAKNTAERLLHSELGQVEAVQLMLVQSAAMQAMVAQNMADTALATQEGRLINPTMTWESVTSGGEKELLQSLSFGLLDLLTYPQRKAVSDQRVVQRRIELASDVVEKITAVKVAWVKAVAAQESERYAQQVHEAAQIGAELANRMQAVGNINRLTQSKHQSFYLHASNQWLMAKQTAASRREALVQALGLDRAQAQRLRLPERLPDIPSSPLNESDIASLAQEQRLDIQLAKAVLQTAAKVQGLNQITSLTDVELSFKRGSINDQTSNSSQSRQGYEVGVRLPIFDTGDLKREAMNSQTLAAANRLQATLDIAQSQWAESFGAYAAAYAISRQYKQDILPLQQRMADENLLRYNGMLLSVFDLLADARDQANTVINAIQAQEQFWLAEANLKSTLMGRPSAMVLIPSKMSSNPAAAH